MNILIVDDDPVTLKLLSSRFSSWGHTVQATMDGEEALTLVREKPIDIVVSDWLMPGIDGLELCRRIRGMEEAAYIYLIMISTQDSKADILQGLESGVDDYLAKPIDMETLKARIDIGTRIVTLERSLKRKVDIITANHYQTIRMFSQIVEVFDEDLGGHCRRTAKIAVELAHRHPDVVEADIPAIEAAALLHDIGMVGIPKAILNKRRTEMVGDEHKLYQSHPEMGARIIGEIEILKPAALMIRMHHEQYNGKGFPDGVSGDAIPLGAQIVSGASMYDNLINKGKIALEDAVDPLRRYSGYQLSPSIAEQLIEFNLNHQMDHARQTASEISLKDLVSGMVLAANVYMKTGAFVMAADTELNTYAIDKLKQYHGIGAILPTVLIHKGSMRS